jgi:hypothetical protein
MSQCTPTWYNNLKKEIVLLFWANNFVKHQKIQNLEEESFKKLIYSDYEKLK